MAQVIFAQLVAGAVFAVALMVWPGSPVVTTLLLLFVAATAGWQVAHGHECGSRS